MRETFVGKDDRVYGQLAKAVMDRWKLNSIKEVIVWPESRKLEALDLLVRETGVLYVQIAKFLHLRVTMERG